MTLKAETDPITTDEWLIRLVWHDRFTRRTPNISPGSFDPRPNETDGISFFRQACLNNPAEVLNVIDATKRPRYGLVRVRVSLLAAMGLTVKSEAIATVKGHVVVPEINITDYLADKARFTPIKLQLAQEASVNILQLPLSS